MGTLTPDETLPGAVIYSRVEDKHVVRVLVRETIDSGIVFAVQDAEHAVPYQWCNIAEYASSHEAVNWAKHHW